MTNGPRCCVFCSKPAHGLYGDDKIPKCLEHSRVDVDGLTPAEAAIIRKRFETPNAPEPVPTANDRRPTWELVIEDVQDVCKQYSIENSAIGVIGDGMTPLVLADMRERDQMGRAKYSTPLQAFNGRNNLVDAYQELLDFAVYVRVELEEQGVLDADPSREARRTLSGLARILISAYHDALFKLHVFRALIERKKKGQTP